MKYIINKSTDPYFNLALDEYAMKHIECDEDFFFLWQNDNAIIIGNNQSALAEINEPFVKEKNIKVARRVSGGGAVYHDLGNLNFTIITNVKDPKDVNYRKYSEPIIKALASMGVNAEISGRNDIGINGLKVSGQAQSLYKGRLMHHGTLLYDVNLEVLVEALNVDPDKIVSKGIKSIRSRVTNIKEHMPKDEGIHVFWDKLQYFLSNEGKDEEIKLTEKDIEAVNKLADEKFRTWEWIYGKSPKHDLKNEKRFSGGKVIIHLDIEDNIIKDIQFLGDFLSLKDVKDVEQALIGTKYQFEDVNNVLSKFNLLHYFGTISKEEIIHLIFGK